MEMEEMSMEGPISTILPTWKLYDNPLFIYNPHNHHHHRHHCFRRLNCPPEEVHDHLLHQSMESEDPTPARIRIKELKAELEHERRLRKKAESLNKALGRELSEEMQRRQETEQAWEELSEEVSRTRAEMERLRGVMEEERRMMRVSEVLREERVQMKLSEAKFLMEEKLLELSSTPPMGPETDSSPTREEEEEEEEEKKEREEPSRTTKSSIGDSKSSDQSRNSVAIKQRKEVENPHIRRGIVGFVEFPRVVRTRATASGVMGSAAAGAREGKGDVGPKLECQKAQLRVLLKHHNRVSPMGTLGPSGADNCVM